MAAVGHFDASLGPFQNKLPHFNSYYYLYMTIVEFNPHLSIPYLIFRSTDIFRLTSLCYL